MNNQQYPLPEGWEWKPLSSLATIVSGGTPSREVPDFWAPPLHAWVTPTDITGKSGRFLFDAKERISDVGLSNSSATMLPIGTILMTSRATLGEAKIARIPCCTNQGFKSLVPKRDVPSEYLYYLLQLFKEKYQKLGIGSTFLEVNKKDTEKFLLPVAPPSLRPKIANILCELDDHIDSTLELIGKYEVTKQGLMADLFSRGIDPVTGKFRPSLQDAPERYHKTSIGWLPKEWNVVALQDISSVERGKFTHRPRDDQKCYGGKHPFIQTGDVSACDGGVLSQYKQTLSDFGRSVSKSFPAGTIAVTIAANIADTAILNSEMCFPDSVVGIIVNNDAACNRFVELCIRMNKGMLDARAPQSAQKNINLEDLRPLLVPFPSITEQVMIGARYDSLADHISNLKLEQQKLQVQKAGLMRDLLTGKVPVSA